MYQLKHGRKVIAADSQFLNVASYQAKGWTFMERCVQLVATTECRRVGRDIARGPAASPCAMGGMLS
jgi:hypothetical protein